MNRSRSVSETSVGLFAFLDVLMSTMGSLILVLMVVTPKIRQEAVAKAAAAVQHAAESRPASEAQDALKKPAPAYVPTPAPEPPREIVDLNAKLKVELAALSQKAQDRQRLADASHESLTVTQAALHKDEAELEALERRLEQILSAKRRMAASLAKVSSEGIAVESRLAGTKARLRKLHGQIAQNSTVYKFVAYDGVTGTTRRPILIECTREHIKFLQEDVSLSFADVSGYSTSYNPVLAGAQALIDFWKTHSGPDEPRPYVLLIVRPSGAVAYGAARHLLERMKDPFGYELLPDDQQLDVPPAIPEAAEVCRNAVERAISQRVDAFKDVFGNGMAPSSGRVAGGKGGDGTGGSPNGAGKSPFDDAGDSLLGGLKHGGQQVASGTPDRGVPGQLGGTGTQSGVEGSTTTGNSGPTDGGPAGAAGGPGGVSSSSNPAALASDSSRVGNAGTADHATGSGGSPSRADGGLGSDARSGGLNGTPQGQGGGSMPGAGNPGLTAAGGANLPQPNGGAGGGDQSGASSRGPVLSPGDGVTRGVPGTVASGSATPRIGTPTSAIPSGNSSASNLSSGGDESGVGPRGAEGERGELPPPILPASPAASAAATDSSGDNFAVGRPAPGSGSSEASGTTTSVAKPSQNALDSGLFGSPRPGAPAPGATLSPISGGVNSAGSTAGDGQPTEPSSSSTPGNQPQSTEGGGMPSFGSPPAAPSDGEEGSPGSPSDASSNSQAADSSGIAAKGDEYDAPRRNNGQPPVRRWGISSPRASIGYEHDLAIYIESGRIYVGSQPPIACGRRETSDQLGVAVFRAVNREARTWGRPRENFYWVPSLRIVVCAGGIAHYERLQPAIERHGLSSTVEFRLERSRPAPLPRLVTD